MESLQREFVYLSYYFMVQLEQIMPYWILGMLLGSAVSVFMKDRIISAREKAWHCRNRLRQRPRYRLPAVYVRHDPGCRLLFPKRSQG